MNKYLFNTVLAAVGCCYSGCNYYVFISLFMNNMHFGMFSVLEIWRIKQLFLCFFFKKTFKDLTKVRVFIKLVEK